MDDNASNLKYLDVSLLFLAVPPLRSNGYGSRRMTVHSILKYLDVSQLFLAVPPLRNNGRAR